MASSSLVEGNVLYQKKNMERRKAASFQAISIPNFNAVSEKWISFLGLTILSGSEWPLLCGEQGLWHT